MAINHEELIAKSNAIRLELKQWEKQFAVVNNGCKAGRDDIKKDAAIAAKYKEYNKIRDIVSGKPAPFSPEPTRKRKAADQPVQTPFKARIVAANILNQRDETEEGSQVKEVWGSARKLFTPSTCRVFIGPTPHRDGKVLGLFDLLSSRGSEATPVKGTRVVLGTITSNVEATPSKPRQRVGFGEEEIDMERARASSTPASRGKRFLPSTFTTPQKRNRKYSDEGHETTPQSVSKGFATPAFLRRDSQRLDTLVEEPQSPVTAGPCWKRRGLGRGLSSIIAGLRQTEEDKLNEEMDILREIEGEGNDSQSQGVIISSKVLVEDSQNVVIPGHDGFDEPDDETENDELPSDALDANGNPRKVWKKKGLKRQTRRTIMKPVRSRPKAAPDLATVPEEGEEGHVSGPDMQTVPESQNLDTQDALSETVAHDDDPDHKESLTAREKRKGCSPSSSKTNLADSKNVANGREGVVKKAARMISAQAHANYRALKIKSKNSKAKGGGRFGRGRR